MSDIDAALRAFRKLAQDENGTVELHMRTDGRVVIYVTRGGRYYRIDADLEPGGPLPTPAKAMRDAATYGQITEWSGDDNA